MTVLLEQVPARVAPALEAFVPRAADTSAILEPAPINPLDILDGEPVARCGAVVDLGGGLSVWLWDCTAGRFRWSFGDCDEIVHIVAGAVVITDQQGTTFRLKAGDVAAFRAFTTATWYVEEHVHKVAVTRTHPPAVPKRVVRKLRHLGARLRPRESSPV